GNAIGNRVHDLPGTGGYAGILGDCCSYDKIGIQVIGNVVDNIGPYPNSSPNIHGIYVAGPHNVVWNNIVTRAAGACIQVWHSTEKNIIANNTVANCAHWGILIGGGSTSAGYNPVTNNIVVNNGGGGAADAAGLIEYDARAA